MLVFALGIKAVGKSKVIQELNKTLAGKIREISYGDVMLEIAKREEHITDREQIAALPPAKQKSIREKAAREIRSAADKEPFLFLNTHGFIYTLPHHSYLPGSPDSVSDLLKPDAVLLVEASPEAIIDRRKRDFEAGRKREIGTEEEIKTALMCEKVAAIHLSIRYSCDLKIFDNTKRIEDATEEIGKLYSFFNSFMK